METFKKNAVLAQQLVTWLGSHPESEHLNDRERWFDVINQSLMKKIQLDFDEIRAYIKKNKKWIPEFTDEFIDRKELEYFAITNFFDYYSNKINNSK